MNEALKASLEATPLHEETVLLSGRAQDYACVANESTLLRDLAFDLRCEPCLMMATARVRGGSDPVIRVVDSESREISEMQLSAIVVAALQRYEFKVPTG